MKNFFQILGVFALFAISLLYTEQAVTVVRQLDDFMIKINEVKEQYEITGHQDYVFCSMQRSNTMLSATTLNRMLEYIDLKGVTAHDFRATASTVLNEKGYSEDWIEKQLAHSHQNKTRASYNHAQYLNDRRKMLQDWADMVDTWGK